MRSIHPFPARMAPDTVVDWLRDLPAGSRVLDPMCGSGVVLRQSAMNGHNAMGFDVDPLAVLMSKVWTRRGAHSELIAIASDVVRAAMHHKKTSHLSLPWIAECPETRAFVEYWFAEPQLSQLARIVWEIERRGSILESWQIDALRLALSRIIVTKTIGASLAWDVSHSRPHRKRNSNEFDVFDGFRRSASRLSQLLDEEKLVRGGKVRLGDCRKLKGVADKSIDAIVTSPPYLNAIDYLRGHKLSLVWMGYGIPTIRGIRGGAVGTERAGDPTESAELLGLENTVRSIRKLPARQRSIVRKYSQDASLMLAESKRVLVPGGLMVLVLGNSNLCGTPVHNSRIFSFIAEKFGFALLQERRRPLLSTRRYLPISNTTSELSRRMKYEVVQAYRLPSKT